MKRMLGDFSTLCWREVVDWGREPYLNLRRGGGNKQGERARVAEECNHHQRKRVSTGHSRMTTQTEGATAQMMHQCPSSTSEKKMMDYLSDLNRQKLLMTSCAEALRASTLCSAKAMEEGLDCHMVPTAF